MTPEEESARLNLIAQAVVDALTEQHEDLAAIVILYPADLADYEIVPSGMSTNGGEEETNAILASMLPEPEEQPEIWTPDQGIVH